MTRLTKPRFRATRRGRFIGIALIAASILGVFGPALATNQSFAFRDAAHFYYPLFYWTAQQWKSGQLPLWNPLDDLGTPLVADATSSVFYPGKLLLLMPGPFATWYKLYIAAHVLMCGISAWYLARHWKASGAGATVGGMSYSLGGCVLFQYCNVVYLVGAAWLPLAIQSGDALLQKGGWAKAVCLAICLGMMVLGGDAQAAYHAGLLLLALAWMRRRQLRALARRSQQRAFGPRSISGAGGLWGLVTAAALAICLAAIQWLPSAAWIQESTRASFTTPRTVYEIPQFMRRQHSVRETAAWQSLAAVTQDGTHHQRLFDFSVGPWQLADLIWPNFGGQLFPTNQRWMSAIPAAGRVWTPSLYMGLMPLLIAGLTFRLRGGTVQRRWLSWCVLISVLGSCGYYGAGWLLSEICFDLGWDVQPPVGAAFGGLYWLFTVLLPGYVLFRYPAKLWVITALGISQLSALGWDLSVRTVLSRLRWPLFAICIASGCGLVFILAAPIEWGQLLKNTPSDRLFGPFDVAGARAGVMRSLGHAFLLAAACYACLQHFSNTGRRHWGWPLVALTALELVIAQRVLVPLAPTALWHKPSPLLDKRPIDTDVPARVFRSQTNWFPPAWRVSSSPARQIDGVAWDRATLFPKHHLLENLALVPSRHSMRSAHFAALFHAAGEVVDKPGRIPTELLRYFGVDFMITPPDRHRYPQKPYERLPLDGVNHAIVWRSEIESPRVWLVHDVDWLPPVDPRDWTALLDRSRQIVSRGQDGIVRDFSSSAVVAAAIKPTAPDFPPSHDDPIPRRTVAPNSAEAARIITYQARQVDLAVRLAEPGLVVLNDTFASGWHAEVSRTGHNAKDTVPIYRTNGIMRGIFLPAGDFEIRMTYRPQGFYSGLVVSGLAWSVCLLYLVVHLGFHFIRRVGTQP